MKWETKDKLLKLGLAMIILAMIVGFAFSYNQCQRDSVEKMLYGDSSEFDCTLKDGCNYAK